MAPPETHDFPVSCGIRGYTKDVDTSSRIPDRISEDVAGILACWQASRGGADEDGVYDRLLVGMEDLVGTFVAFDFMPRTLPYFLVVAASSFLYVAMADLIPGLHRGRTDASSLRQIVLIGLGIATMVWFY